MYFKILRKGNYGVNRNSDHIFNLGLNTSESDDEYFYFCSKEFIVSNIYQYAQYICEVEIPDNNKEEVSALNCYRCKSIIIKDIKPLCSVATYEWLEENDVDISSEINSLLVYGVCNDWTSVCEYLLNRGASMRVLGKDTLLSIAAKNGNYKMCCDLIDHGADKHECNDIALTQAAKNGYLGICGLLFDNDSSPYNALRSSIENNHYDVCEFLLEKCNNKFIDTYFKHNNLLIPCILNNNSEMFKLLLDYGAGLYTDLEDDNYMLELAVKNSNYMIIDLLLEYGASMDISKPHMLTIAQHYGYKDTNSFICDYIKKNKKEGRKLCILKY